jgi:hypothetical protein
MLQRYRIVVLHFISDEGKKLPAFILKAAQQQVHICGIAQGERNF